MKRGYVILSLGDNHFRNSYTITAAVTGTVTREVRINCWDVDHFRNSYTTIAPVTHEERVCSVLGWVLFRNSCTIILN